MHSNTLTARWAATITGDQSTVFSGAGVWPLLVYLAAGTTGREHAELTAATGLATAADATQLLERLTGTDGVACDLAIEVQPWIDLRPTWTSVVPAKLLGQPADPEVLLRLLSAVGARTRWLQPFKPTLLAPRTGVWRERGRQLAGLYRATPGLSTVSAFDTPAGPLTSVAVAGDNGITVHLVLGEPSAPPAAVLRAGIEALDGRFPSADVTTAPGVQPDLPSPLDEPHTFLVVPRFSVEADHDLLATAEVFGLLSVTNRSCQRFPLMSEQPLAVLSASQIANASFTDEGFEAAAVTVVSFAGGSYSPAPKHHHLGVNIDRPFGFIACHGDLVLFAGWIAEAEEYHFPEGHLVRLDPRCSSAPSIGPP